MIRENISSTLPYIILIFILFGINTRPTDQATVPNRRKESITNEVNR